MLGKSSANPRIIIIAADAPRTYPGACAALSAMEEDIMKTLMLTLAGIAALATRAAAHDTTTPFPTRGACEAASAAMSNDERDVVLASFPELFDNRGDVSSFLTRAF